MTKPRLRMDLQMAAVTLEGRRMITIHDPYQLGGGTMALDMGALPLLQLLDGRHDLRDIQMELMGMQSGQLVLQSEIESFVSQLDQACLLDSDFFRGKMAMLREEFLAGSCRPFVHGGFYDNDPGNLARLIDETEKTLPPPEPAGEVTGILAPHIDIQVARAAYVDIYRRLRGRRYDLVIILGVNHHFQDGLYSVSEKSYLTPFGELPADREQVRRLKEKLPAGTLASDDFGHKMEHSIEFQTLFLHHYLGAGTPILPILCGGIHEFVLGGKHLFTDGRYQAMLSALRQIIDQKDGKVLCVAGVDFSHVGLKFGDQLPAAVLLATTRSNDEAILSHLLKGETEKIFENAVETKDRYKVCGLPAIILLSHLLEGTERRLFASEIYDEASTQSAVTYASVLFTCQTASR